MASVADYDRAAGLLRQPARIIPGCAPDPDELVRCAALAASSHNTQPWLFRVRAGEITITPDFSRRCPVVDPDDAHLYKSLGCAAENLVQAAAAQGLAAETAFDPAADAVKLRLEPAAGLPDTGLFQAIFKRQCTRTPYDGSPLTRDELGALEQAGREGCAHTLLLTEKSRIEGVLDYVSRGNDSQLNDPAFRKELLHWIRFNPAEALRSGDGLSGRSNGQPALPRWIANRLMGLVLTARGQTGIDARNIRSSAAIAVIVAAGNERAAWIDAGRACQRLALRATALDLRSAFINQPLEVTALRPQLESWLGLNGMHALLMIRLGRAPLAPYSLRRPLEQVIVRE
jgi:hypothetical protein